MACVNLIVADTDEVAYHLATSFYQLALGLFRNNRRPLPPPVASMNEIWTEPEKAGVQQMLEYSFIGSRDTVKKSLQYFVDDSGIDEIMFATHVYDSAAKRRSMELAASLFK